MAGASDSTNSSDLRVSRFSQGDSNGTNARKRIPLNFERHLKKTKLCNYYARGCCYAGSECTFAHGREELMDLPNFSKTKLCRYKDNADGCPYPECRFAHNEFELEKGPVPVSNNTPHTQLAGWVTNYEAQLGQLVAPLNLDDASDILVQSTGLGELVARRCWAFALAAAGSKSPLPRLSGKSIEYEAQILQLVSQTYYED